MKPFRLAVCLFALISLLMGYVNSTAQPPLPPCDQRPHFIDPPWVNSSYYCAELVIHDDSGGELGFTSLAPAPDGRLYATRPLSGQVWLLSDSDADGLPDAASLLIEGLTLPNGLAYHEDALYISGGSFIYKWENNRLSTLTDELPSGSGFWTGGVIVGPDDRLYVGIGAACDACVQQQPDRGVILSFALDGTDKQVVASGLRQPNDLVFANGSLWTVDTARDGLGNDTDYDELNRVQEGEHFGWPFCIGRENTVDIETANFDCTQSTPPSLTFASHSNPLGMTVYEGSAFPHLSGQLLVTLGGTSHEAHLNGFTLVTIGFDDAGQPTTPHIILPEVPSLSPQWAGITLQKMHYQASGFWQHHPFDVTISREGWIYVSLGGGTIWALRPR